MSNSDAHNIMHLYSEFPPSVHIENANFRISMHKNYLIFKVIIVDIALAEQSCNGVLPFLFVKVGSAPSLTRKHARTILG